MNLTNKIINNFYDATKQTLVVDFPDCKNKTLYLMTDTGSASWVSGSNWVPYAYVRTNSNGHAEFDLSLDKNSGYRFDSEPIAVNPTDRMVKKVSRKE